METSDKQYKYVQETIYLWCSIESKIHGVLQLAGSSVDTHPHQQNNKEKKSGSQFYFFITKICLVHVKVNIT